MRNSNNARRIFGTVAAGVVSLTACVAVVLAPTSADAINSLAMHSRAHSQVDFQVNSL